MRGESDTRPRDRPLLARIRSWRVESGIDSHMRGRSHSRPQDRPRVARCRSARGRVRDWAPQWGPIRLSTRRVTAPPAHPPGAGADHDPLPLGAPDHAASRRGTPREPPRAPAGIPLPPPPRPARAQTPPRLPQRNRPPPPPPPPTPPEPPPPPPPRPPP